MTEPRITDTGRLKEIESRVAAAIQAPWLRIGFDITKPEVDIVRWSYVDLPPSEWEGAEAEIAPTLDFIAHAREDVPWLIKRIRELERAPHSEPRHSRARRSVLNARREPRIEQGVKKNFWTDREVDKLGFLCVALGVVGGVLFCVFVEWMAGIL